MGDKNLKGMNFAAFSITAVTMLSAALNMTGVSMMDAGTLETLKQVIDVGITPVLLLVFVYYFINKSKGDDKRVNAAYRETQEKIEKMTSSARMHEDAMAAENARREEMLNMEKITVSMDSITRTLDRMENSFSGIESRLEKIEYKIGDGDKNG